MASNPSHSLLLVTALGLALLGGLGAYFLLQPQEEARVAIPPPAPPPPVQRAPRSTEEAGHLPPEVRSTPRPEKIRAAGHPAPPAPAIPAAPRSGADADVGRAIADIHSAVDECLQSRARENPQFSGKVIVTFTLDRDASGGTAKDAEIGDSSLPDDSAEGCITSAVESAHFPDIVGTGPIAVEAPFTVGP